MINRPFITDDTIVFGLLMLLLAFVFYTSSIKDGFWKKFYIIFPSLLMCYLLPSIFSSLNIISPEWSEMGENGEIITQKSSIYFIASRYLLPAALVLMTLSIDLKAMFKLGPKALIMFFTGTVGVIIGAPLAVLIMSIFSPETVGGAGFDAVWRGLSTIAGSWIGGGANQAAMLEVFQYNQEKYGAMVLVDIVVANIWMAILLFGIGRKEKIDKWLKADNRSIDELKEKVTAYSSTVTRNPSLTDLMVILGIAFTAVGLSHWGSNSISDLLKANFTIVNDPTSFASTFGDRFFWMVTIATALGILFSFTKLKEYEGAGASKIGSVFIYILVASIGMKMDLGSVMSNPGLLVVGLIWMSIHVLLLVIVAKIIKAPYFFLAVGSKANIGGAASAPIIASAFHPSLASVGVLLAVFGYVIGTYGALLATFLMEIAAPK
ncbi:Uncharacterized membrane protein [Flavobacterium segetis]|uniref:Uncharacterized membrane protein n=1 Tax=Flavobacterium segetis TaxID=271157 RepID=A0A1M5G427_9FLAO|nr:DUF819 family protein [Flavobacterium segetis]SHF98478.1 Uncharacterized membrane protein [Flavobacterium segetis]